MAKKIAKKKYACRHDVCMQTRNRIELVLPSHKMTDPNPIPSTAFDPWLGLMLRDASAQAGRLDAVQLELFFTLPTPAPRGPTSVQDQSVSTSDQDQSMSTSDQDRWDGLNYPGIGPIAEPIDELELPGHGEEVPTLGQDAECRRWGEAAPMGQRRMCKDQPMRALVGHEIQSASSRYMSN